VTGDAASSFDRAKAEAFAGKMLAALNHGALCLMASVGHRTGLFDVMSQSGPATPHEIATRAGVEERYVREWLGALTTGETSQRAQGHPSRVEIGRRVFDARYQRIEPSFDKDVEHPLGTFLYTASCMH
jgi:hypothetical protein